MKRSLAEVSPLLLVFVLLGLACGVVVPPFENLDELEHFGVVRHIADTGRLPVHGAPEAAIYHYRQEASQPPLYYLLSAGLVRLLGLRADDAAAYIRLKPRVFCGPVGPALYDNRAIFYHNPHREAFPWQGTLLMLHVLRAGSTLLQTVTVAGTYFLACWAFPRQKRVALLATAIVALNPQFLLVASGVNNDNLVTPLATLGLYLLLRTMQAGLSLRKTLTLALLVGLAGLSKLSGWLLLPLSLLVILLALSRSRRGARFQTVAISLIGYWSLVIFIPLALSGWWFWRNGQLYGDPTALQPMLELVRRRADPVFPLVEWNLVFRSFWGQIPCAFYPSAFYIPYALLVCAGIAGWMMGWRRFAPGERWVGALLAGWFLLVLIGWMRWDMMTHAAGGRLLFPALPAIALLMAAGIARLTRWRWLIPGTAVALALLALAVIAGILPAFFAPPPLRSPDAVSPKNPTDVTFGKTIRLLGYDLRTHPEERWLDITLYWQATTPVPQDYNIALQLVSPVPGDDTLRWTYDAWPGRGNYPTTAWQPGLAIVDRYRFRIPDADFLTQAWDLQLTVYEEKTMTPLPVSAGETPVGNRWVLARLRWPGREPSCPEEGRLTSDIRFGGAIALTHAQVTPEGEDIRVTLCWESLSSIPQDEHVFVHLYDAEGSLRQAGDGP
ncbi:MAG: glycosyltransferase family 39 protein, partial [Anaerolineae bacterium]|nr:glycosyltransferase family 39 protein [Anaerolineae bacterium]